MSRRDPIGARYAVRGLAVAWRGQRNLRVEALVGVAALAGTAWLGVSPVPVLLCCGLVLCAELGNTALESVVDLIAPDVRPLAGRAKDVAAGAVLTAAAVSVLVGIAHLGPPLVARISRGPT